MLNENIRKFRKGKGMSQEALAVKLHVVRQTISKWETGLSIPNAEQVVQLAEVLGVSVNQLLDAVSKDQSVEGLEKELARMEKQLAEKNQRERLLMQANQKRGLILFLSFLAMVMMLIIQNGGISMALAGLCLLAAIVILYRNLDLLTRITTQEPKIGLLKVATIFTGTILLVCILVVGLMESKKITLSEDEEKNFALFLVSCVMLFTGLIAPKLPFNRHTGLRLPWTVQDEDTWNLAHQILGYQSVPMVLLYLACAWTTSNFKLVTICTLLVWIGVPGLISLFFFWKKFHGGA